MMTKYGFDISEITVQVDLKRLINQTWKIIPMSENHEDWKKQLDTILTEVIGLQEIFCNALSFLQILSKIEGLLNRDVEFALLRKTVFEIISLLQELNYEIDQIK